MTSEDSIWKGTEQMNSRERVEMVFRRERADHLPVYHVGFSSGVASELLGREAYVGGGIQQWREATALWQGEQAHQDFLERSFRDAIDLALLCEQDVVRTRYWRYPRKPTRRVDDYTYLYEYGSEGDWQVLRYDPASEQCTIADVVPKAAMSIDDLEVRVEAEERAILDYQPDEERFASELRAHSFLGNERVVRVNAGGISIPTDSVWLEATLLAPDLVGRHLDVQVERARRDLAFLSDRGLTWFFGGGDLASNDGPLYSARTFRKLLLPRLKRIVDAAHACGGRYFFCSDGNLWPVAYELFEVSGIDGYCEIDRLAGMDLRELRSRYPRLGLIGNISSYTAHVGTREQVVCETRACLDEARSCGGVVVGASNYFVPGTPIENVRAVLETIRQHR